MNVPHSSRGHGFVLGAYGVAAGAAVAAARIALLRGAGASERAERLGAAPPPCGPGRLLLHAVSAGEMTAAWALAAEIERTAPGVKLLLTTGTSEGRIVAERAREACRAVEAVSFLPWDRPAAVRRWLSRLAPSAVVTVEAELWPGLYLGARSLGIPVAVASGRLRPGEARRYALLGRFFRPVVGRGLVDRRALGSGPREVSLDRREPCPRRRDRRPEARRPGAERRRCDRAWEAHLGSGPPLLVAASTHAPEEELLLAAVKRLRGEGVDVRLALAPRRVARAGEVERLARGAGFETRRLSGSPGPAPVLVVDTFGLLSSLWPHAAVGFLGGTLAPVGGHSPVDAAEAGVPLVAGPSLDGVRELADTLRTAGALVDVGGDGAADGLDGGAGAAPLRRGRPPSPGRGGAPRARHAPRRRRANGAEGPRPARRSLASRAGDPSNEGGLERRAPSARLHVAAFATGST